MTLPATLAAVSSVTQVAAKAIQTFGQSSFAAILSQAGPEAGIEADSSRTATELGDEIAQTVRNVLGKLGQAVNQPIEVSVQADGNILVQSDHQLAAAIEAELVTHDQLANLARQYRKSGGTESLLVKPPNSDGLTF